MSKYILKDKRGLYFYEYCGWGKNKNKAMKFSKSEIENLNKEQAEAMKFCKVIKI